jgi:hypothetical protein
MNDNTNGIPEEDIRAAGFDPRVPADITNYDDPRNWDVIYDEDGTPIAR